MYRLNTPEIIESPPLNQRPMDWEEQRDMLPRVVPVCTVRSGRWTWQLHTPEGAHPHSADTIRIFFPELGEWYQQLFKCTTTGHRQSVQYCNLSPGLKAQYFGMDHAREPGGRLGYRPDLTPYRLVRAEYVLQALGVYVLMHKPQLLGSVADHAKFAAANWASIRGVPVCHVGTHTDLRLPQSFKHESVA